MLSLTLLTSNPVCGGHPLGWPKSARMSLRPKESLVSLWLAKELCIFSLSKPPMSPLWHRHMSQTELRIQLRGLLTGMSIVIGDEGALEQGLHECSPGLKVMGRTIIFCGFSRSWKDPCLTMMVQAACQTEIKWQQLWGGHRRALQHPRPTSPSLFLVTWVNTFFF